MKFYQSYFILAITLFIIEAAIAACMHDSFIRPYFGDLLVVILIYCAVKAFVNTPPIKTAVMVLLFACLIELSQYFQLVALLGWGRSATAVTVLGSFFSFTEIIMYALGALAIICTQTYLKNSRKNLK